MSEHFQPGLHDIPAERYFAADGVSASMLSILTNKTPAHLKAWLEGEQKQTEATRFGTLLHYAVLQPDIYRDRFHVRPEGLKFTTKAGMEWRILHDDKPIIDSEDSAQIDKMVSAVHSHPFAKRLLHEGRPECSLFVEDAQGTLRKSRFDILTKGNVLSDIKTVESADMESFERTINKFGYHRRAAYYLDNCNLAGIDKTAFFFICVEKSPPYAVRCLQLMAEVIEYGKILYQRDLQIYRNCLETGIWPAWEDGFSEVSLPSWEMKQLENTLK